MILFEFLIAATVFLTATAYLPNQGMDTAQGVAFRVGCVAIMILTFNMKPLRFIVNKWLNLLLGLCFALTLFLPQQAQAVAINPFINIFLGVGLFYAIANYAKGDMILNALCMVVIANAFMALLQFLGIDPLIVNINGSKPQMTGLFEYRYAFGVYMGVLTPVLLYFGRRTFAILSAILTICSMSYAAIGIMGISLLALSYKTKFFRLALTIAILLSVLGGILVSKVPQNSPLNIVYKAESRLEMQSRFIPQILYKPIGYGLGCFKYIGPRVASGDRESPAFGPWGDVTDGWCDYLERTMELGIIFLIIFGFLITNVLKRGGLLLIGIPLNMAFHSCLNHFNLCVLFITLLALWEVKVKAQNA